MTNYTNTPDDVLARMRATAHGSLTEWVRRRDKHEEELRGAKEMVESYTKVTGEIIEEQNRRHAE